MDCIFCNIAERKAQAEILYEDDKVISFLDIRPVNYGHSLVIPKKHYDKFEDVPLELLNETMRVAKIISQAITKSINPDGFNILANNGKAAGQTVYHFHFHIMPRFSNDVFTFKLNLKSYSDELLTEYANKIRKEIEK